MKEAKGGTFSSVDFGLIKKALYSYKDDIINSDVDDAEKDKELSMIANLLHRLGRVN